MMEKQVDQSAYRFSRYCGIDRWASYHYQISEILATEPKTVLEVGVGDGVVGAYLKHSGVSYTSVDIADDVGADVVGSITKLPCTDHSFDTVCAFEVLEHLPHTSLPECLSELARVAQNKVIISVPHFGPALQVRFKIPLLKQVTLSLKIPVPLTHVFNGQHYWELGKRGFPVHAFRAALRGFFVIEKEFVPFENQYHHFFVLKPK